MTEPEGPSKPPQDPPAAPPPEDPPSDPPAPPEDPPSDPPAAPPSDPPASAPASGSPNAVMIVLSYLWLLALVPLLVEKDDKEVQWHAKHGLVLVGAEILFWIGLTIVSLVPFLGAVGCLGPFIWLGFLAVHVAAIVKGIGGGRLIIPGVSQYADKF